MTENNKRLQKEIEEIKDTLQKHTVYLERILTKIYPQSSRLNIFPISSREDLINIDKKIESIPEDQLVRSFIIFQCLTFLIFHFCSDHWHKGTVGKDSTV